MLLRNEPNPHRQNIERHGYQFLPRLLTPGSLGLLPVVNFFVFYQRN
jgi:hypothetical protein